jgi:hypothetical protein
MIAIPCKLYIKKSPIVPLVYSLYLCIHCSSGRSILITWFPIFVIVSCMLIPILTVMTMAITMVVMRCNLLFYLEDKRDGLFCRFSLIPFRTVLFLPKYVPPFCFCFKLLLFVLRIFKTSLLVSGYMFLSLLGYHD